MPPCTFFVGSTDPTANEHGRAREPSDNKSGPRELASAVLPLPEQSDKRGTLGTVWIPQSHHDAPRPVSAEPESGSAADDVWHGTAGAAAAFHGSASSHGLGLA